MAIGIIFCHLLAEQSLWKGKCKLQLIVLEESFYQKKIRNDFNLEPGTQIHIEESGQEIILKPIHEEPSLRLKEGVLVFTGTPLDDRSNVVAKHREERLKSLGKHNERSF